MPPSVPEFVDLLRALNERNVRYVIVGGLAMVLQGATYVTFDLDIAIALDSDTSSAIVQALAPFHPYPPNLNSADNFVWDERSLFGSVVSLVTSAGHVDMLRTLPEVDSFEGMWERSSVRELGGQTVRVASIADLITLKRAANRPKDIDHIRQLLALLKLADEK